MEQIPNLNATQPSLARVFLCISGFLLIPATLVLGMIHYVSNEFSEVGTVSTAERPLDQPAEIFTKLTQLPWPESARVQLATDSHGGFLGDGELRIHFEADPQDLKTWETRKPPWGGVEWKPGKRPTDFRNSRAKQFAVKSNSAMFCAEDYQYSKLPWHNGRTLSVNLETGQVELFYWDY